MEYGFVKKPLRTCEEIYIMISGGYSHEKEILWQWLTCCWPSQQARPLRMKVFYGQAGLKRGMQKRRSPSITYIKILDESLTRPVIFICRGINKSGSQRPVH